MSDGRITNVGKVDGQTQRELDADGQLLLPGWVDIHTHYDGQATWDPEMTPSSWHGVTTAVLQLRSRFCASPERDRRDLMEGVEDIPRTVLEKESTSHGKLPRVP